MDLLHEKKSEVFDTFKVFKPMVEKSFNKNIKSIISNKGGEYIKGEFQNFCESEGIRMEHSVPYTPQQNGVAERKNISLKEMETCLLHAKHLPPSTWDEASTVLHICIIGCPTSQWLG